MNNTLEKINPWAQITGGLLLVGAGGLFGTWQPTISMIAGILLVVSGVLSFT